MPSWMTKSDASRIQSSQARNNRDMTATGFASRAQSAADRRAFGTVYDIPDFGANEGPSGWSVCFQILLWLSVIGVMVYGLYLGGDSLVRKIIGKVGDWWGKL